MNRLARLTVAVAATALILTSLGAVPAGATTSDHGSIIVATRFSDANGGQPQIVATTPQGGRVRVLTTGHQDSDPHMSPDGKRIVFQRCVDAFECDNVGRINIWVMNADGSHQHALTTCDASRCLGAFNPSFSPDGRWITFTEDLLDANGVNFNGSSSCAPTEPTRAGSPPTVRTTCPTSAPSSPQTVAPSSSTARPPTETDS